jgi:hypothetical protein
MSRSRQAIDWVGEAATSAIGTVAGAAAGPKTAAKQLKATVAKPRVLIGVALLLLAFLRGRRVRT